MNKKVLILGCNYDQIPYIKEIKKRGYVIIGADRNKAAPGKSLCNKFYNVGYDDIEQLIDIAKQERLAPDDKIFTASAQFAHYGAARVAVEVGINYPSPEVINKCLDKVLFYPLFQEWGLPIPKTTIIKDQDEFNEIIAQYDKSDIVFLKSDYSKNPNHVYEFSSECIPDIVWKKDRYYRNYYVLQQKIEGESLRINIFSNQYNVFKINETITTKEFDEKIQKTNCIADLKRFVEGNGLSNWLVKFDAILTDDLEYVVLDIGIDPPSRMLQSFQLMGLDFFQYYINQYLNNQISYPVF
jgi:hypothetical protein